VIAEAQKNGGTAAFIDVEHALDPTYAQALGIDLDNLLVSQPDAGEQALDIAEMLVRSNAVDVVVLDSVAALVTKAELEGDMGDTHVGLQARLMSQALRKLTSAISRSKCVMIFINQLREKIGVMFGSPETTSGGRALKFYASIRIDIRKLEQIKIGQDVVGSRTRAKVVKNKVAPPFRQAEFDITYGRGISKMGSILDVALERNLVGKSGSWYTYGESRIGQGRENAKAYLEEHSDVAAELEQKIREALKATVAPNGVTHPVGAGAASDDE
jgi:recombination protein RecA